VIYNFTSFPESRLECNNGARQDGILNIAIVGQIAPHKGHGLLLDALQMVQDRGGRFKLHIIGTGDNGYISQLKAKSKELNLTENIIWRGYISNREDIYKEIDFVVVPSIRPEPFGLVAIEPAAFGVPAIVASLGGLDEIVRHGETGLKFESGNKEDLAEKVLCYLNASASYARMGVNAFENYRSRFSFINQIREFTLLLQAN
jgi:glycosyltransferase involved in cell wall biosynthesis